MKSSGTAYWFYFLTFIFAGHRWYVGRPFTAILYTCTLGGLGLWIFVDFFLVPGMVREWNRKHGYGDQPSHPPQPTTINVFQSQDKDPK